MKKILNKPLSTLARLFLGKGIIDKYFPFLNSIFKIVYVYLQPNEVKIVNLPNDIKLAVNTRDTGVGIQLLVNNKYEVAQTDLFLKVLKKGDTFVDVGANIGYYSVLASKNIGKDGEVYSFEPDKHNILLLQKNIALNNVANVKIESKAVSDKNGLIEFAEDKYNKGESSIRHNKDSTYQVESVALDSYFNNTKTIDVLKMDIEGAEINAVQGAKNIIKLSKSLHLFIELNPPSLLNYGHKREELIALLRSLNFKLDAIIDDSRNEVLPYSTYNLQRVLDHVTFCNLYAYRT